MKNFGISLILVCVFSTGCDPASMSARVKPEKTVEVQTLNSREATLADVYFSDDKKVELQIYGSGPTTGVSAPDVRAIIVNNHSVPIEIDLSAATYQPKWSSQAIKVTGSWFAGCEAESADSSKCKAQILKLSPGQSKHVSWKTSAEGEFKLPIKSAGQTRDVIVARFERCNPLWGKCETVK